MVVDVACDTVSLLQSRDSRVGPSVGVKGGNVVASISSRFFGNVSLSGVRPKPASTVTRRLEAPFRVEVKCANGVRISEAADHPASLYPLIRESTVVAPGSRMAFESADERTTYGVGDPSVPV